MQVLYFAPPWACSCLCLGKWEHIQDYTLCSFLGKPFKVLLTLYSNFASSSFFRLCLFFGLLHFWGCLYFWGHLSFWAPPHLGSSLVLINTSLFWDIFILRLCSIWSHFSLRLVLSHTFTNKSTFCWALLYMQGL